MTTVNSFIKRHPVSIYFVLTFAISWGGLLLVIGGPGGIPGTREQSETLRPFVFLAMLAGPSLASILLTGIVDGKDGLRDLFLRLCRWRVNIRWYGAAILITPILLTTILVALTLISPVFMPGIFTAGDKVTNLGLSIAAGLTAGFFEELGWTGFAAPKMQLKLSAFATSVTLGLIWAIWHFLADFWGGYVVYGELYFPHYLLWVVALPAYRVLMVWIYNNTRSLLLAQFMHASFTSSQFLLTPTALSVADDVLWYLIFTAALCVAAVVVVRVYGRKRLIRNSGMG